MSKFFNSEIYEQMKRSKAYPRNALYATVPKKSKYVIFTSENACKTLNPLKIERTMRTVFLNQNRGQECRFIINDGCGAIVIRNSKSKCTKSANIIEESSMEDEWSTSSSYALDEPRINENTAIFPLRKHRPKIDIRPFRRTWASAIALFKEPRNVPSCNKQMKALVHGESAEDGRGKSINEIVKIFNTEAIYCILEYIRKNICNMLHPVVEGLYNFINLFYDPIVMLRNRCLYTHKRINQTVINEESPENYVEKNDCSLTFWDLNLYDRVVKLWDRFLYACKRIKANVINGESPEPKPAQLMSLDITRTPTVFAGQQREDEQGGKKNLCMHRKNKRPRVRYYH